MVLLRPVFSFRGQLHPNPERKKIDGISNSYNVRAISGICGALKNPF